MKKKIIILVILLILVLIAILIPKSFYQKLFNNDQETNNTYKETILVYLENQNNEVIGVNVEVNELKEDEISQKWEILTSSNLSNNYKSSIPVDLPLLNKEIIDGKLILYTTDKVKEANGRKALETLAWTFIEDDISEVVIKVDDVVVNNFNDFEFDVINKEKGINLTFETYHLFESNATTVIYNDSNIIKPVTYLHLNDDICSFIVMKAIENATIDYDYKIEDNIMTLDFVDASLLSLNQLTTIVDSIGFNFDFNSLNINNNENLFYQKVFNEVND